MRRKSELFSASYAENKRYDSPKIGILDGFFGNITTSKWAKITKCSQDTAYRDILDLIEKGVIVKAPGGGRNTSYIIDV